MEFDSPDFPILLRALYDFHPTRIQAIIEQSDIEDIAFCAHNFSEFDKTYLYANFTKSELLEFLWYMDKHTKGPVDQDRIRSAYKCVSERIEMVRQQYPKDTLGEAPYDAYSFDEALKKLASAPEDPQLIINFFIAAIMLSHKIAIVDFADYAGVLRNSGLERFWLCIELILNGTEPNVRAQLVRKICHSYPLLIRLLIAEGIDGLQMGHGPLLVHGRMCCVLREAVH